MAKSFILKTENRHEKNIVLGFFFNLYLLLQNVTFVSSMNTGPGQSAALVFKKTGLTQRNGSKFRIILYFNKNVKATL